MTRIAPALLILALAGCARSEEASLVPPDSNQGYNQIGRVGSPEADDREPAIGQWRAALQENFDVLEFGPLGTEPLFSLTCGPDRSLILQRHGGVADGPLPEMQVTRGQFDTKLPVTLGGTAIPMLRAQVPLDGPVVQNVAREGENLTIRLGDGPPLILPSSALVGDYIRGCVSGRPRSVPGGNSGAVANSAAPAPAPAPSNSAAPAANAAQPKQ